MSAVSVGSTEPTQRVGRAWIGRFGLIWLGVWMAWLVPVQLALPEQFDDIDKAHSYRDFGILNGVAGIVTLALLPICGALCDRTRTPFGRTPVSRRRATTGSIVPGMRMSQPSLCVAMASTIAVALNPSITMVGAPDIRAPQVGSAAPEWKSGDQATKASSSVTRRSSLCAIIRAICARWLIRAPFGRPVVPLM